MDARASAGGGRDLILTVFPLTSGGTKPSPRCGHSLTAVEHELYLFGGADDEGIVGDFYKCAIAQPNWELIESNGFSVPGPLFLHTATAVGKRIYVFGGLTVSNTYNFTSKPDRAEEHEKEDDEESGKDTTCSTFRLRLLQARGEVTSNDLYVYDLATRQWAQPIVSGQAPPPRFSHSAAYANGKIWIFGGCKKSSFEVSFNDLYCFDVETNSWSSPRTSGRSPEPRHGHSCVSIGDNKLAFFGGANEDLIIDDVISIQRYNDLYLFDTVSLTWTLSCPTGSPPFPRAFHSAALVGESPRLMYIFAGETSQSAIDLTVLDIEKMQWMRPLFDCAFEHELHGATEISGKMAIFGGVSCSMGFLDDFFLANIVSVGDRHNDFSFKIVLAGDSGVGKSCLITRFVDDTFSDGQASTIGLDFKTINTMVEGKIVRLHIWDTAGQERFQSLSSHYYRGADAVVLVYDTTHAGSFEHIRSWNDEIEEENVSNKKLLKLIVGNKIDLVGSRQILQSEGKSCAKKLSATFVETSASSSINVDVAFLNMARKLVIQRLNEKTTKQTRTSQGLRLDGTTRIGSNTSCC